MYSGVGNCLWLKGGKVLEWRKQAVKADNPTLHRLHPSESDLVLLYVR